MAQSTIFQSEIFPLFFAKESSIVFTSTVGSILNEHVCSSRLVSIPVILEIAFKSLRTEASQPVHVMFGR